MQDSGLHLTREEEEGRENLKSLLALETQTFLAGCSPPRHPLSAVPFVAASLCWEVGGPVRQGGLPATVGGDYLRFHKPWTKHRPDPDNLPFLSPSLWFL